MLCLHTQNLIVALLVVVDTLRKVIKDIFCCKGPGGLGVKCERVRGRGNIYGHGHVDTRAMYSNSGCSHPPGRVCAVPSCALRVTGVCAARASVAADEGGRRSGERTSRRTSRETGYEMVPTGAVVNWASVSTRGRVPGLPVRSARWRRLAERSGNNGLGRRWDDTRALFLPTLLVPTSTLHTPPLSAMPSSAPIPPYASCHASACQADLVQQRPGG